MQDSFSDYAPGTFSNITAPSTVQNGGLGWNATGTGATTADNSTNAPWGAVLPTSLNAGANRSITSPGLTYSATGYLAPSGNKLTLDAVTANASQNIPRPLGGQTIDSGTTFFSLLMSKNTDTQRTVNFAFFSVVGSTNTERFSVGQIGAAAGGSAGNIAMIMNNSNPNGIIQNTTSPIAMGVGITHLLIGRVDWNPSGFETVSMWVDPTDVTTQASAGATYVSTSAFELGLITHVRPFVGNTAGTITAVSANYDEFRIGGTWESVTSLPVAVPEPATFLLAGVGAIGLIAAGRRQKNG
jgi:hypothetical protein